MTVPDPRLAGTGPGRGRFTAPHRGLRARTRDDRIRPMPVPVRAWLSLVLTLVLVAPSTAQDAPGSLDIPVDNRKLDNGLKVVLSPDPTAPIATVAVYYNIGFRIEPRDQIGRASCRERV